MTEELKACPFCGEQDDIDYDYAELSCPEEITTMVICHQCGAMSKCSSAGNLGAAEYWNHRPLETAAYIRGLRRAVEIAAEVAGNDVGKKYGKYIGVFGVISAIESEIQEAQNG